MAYDVRVRDALNKQGIDNNQIAFNNGNVMVDGQNFMKPQKNFQGTTFTDQSSFDQAWSQYNMPKANAVNGQVVQQGQGPAATQPPPNQQMGQGVQTNVPSMQGGMPQGNPQDQYTQMISQVYDRIMNPQSYDVYNSPEYAAQEARAQRGSDQAVRAAQEALGGAGFGRSTVLGERAQGIANNQNDFMMTQVAPQLIAQKRAQEQQQTQNLGNIINYLMSADQANMQRAGLTGEYQGEQTLPGQLQQEQIEGAQLTNDQTRMMLENLPEEIQLNLQNLRNSVKTGELGIQEAEYRIDQMMDPNSIENQMSKLDLETSQLQNQIAQFDVANMDQDRQLRLQEIRARINSANRANIRTPEEVERARLQNQVLQEELNQLQNPEPEPANDVNMDDEQQGLIGALRGGELTAAEALRQIEEDLEFGFYTPEQAEQLRRLTQQYAGAETKKSPPPEPTEEQADELETMPTDRELNAQARELGLPTIDYRSWYKSTKGRLAGTSYEDWKALYGPTMGPAK